MQFRANAAAFFATEENIAFKHAIANVFESDRFFPYLATEFGGDLVDHLRGGKCLCNIARKITRAGKMPEENRENLMRRHKRAVAIDGADAIGISVKRETSVVTKRFNSLAKSLYVRLKDRKSTRLNSSHPSIS